MKGGSFLLISHEGWFIPVDYFPQSLGLVNNRALCSPQSCVFLVFVEAGGDTSSVRQSYIFYVVDIISSQCFSPNELRSFFSSLFLEEAQGRIFVSL